MQLNVGKGAPRMPTRRRRRRWTTRRRRRRWRHRPQQRWGRRWGCAERQPATRNRGRRGTRRSTFCSPSSVSPLIWPTSGASPTTATKMAAVRSLTNPILTTNPTANIESHQVNHSKHPKFVVRLEVISNSSSQSMWSLANLTVCSCSYLYDIHCTLEQLFPINN